MVVMALAIAYFVTKSSGCPGALPPAHERQTSAREPTAPSAATPTDARWRPSKIVAVLPFVNMSADKEQEYFSDGPDRGAIDRLSHSPDLRS